WLDLPYTLHAAVVLQCLHVFAGGLGAAFCARLMGLRWPAALFAGVAWQCFGGFYAHSSHPDIVRSYALMPWIVAPLLAPWGWSRLTRIATILSPVAIAFLCTGGYSGAIVAVLFVAGVSWFARLALQWRDGEA